MPRSCAEVAIRHGFERTDVVPASSHPSATRGERGAKGKDVHVVSQRTTARIATSPREARYSRCPSSDCRPQGRPCGRALFDPRPRAKPDQRRR